MASTRGNARQRIDTDGWHFRDSNRPDIVN
jgi:hypothetical protein